MRVHELAKELGLTSKELLARLHDLGVEAKSHMSTVDGDAAALIREAGVPAAESVPETPAKAEEPPKVEEPPKAEEPAKPAETAPPAPAPEPTPPEPQAAPAAAVPPPEAPASDAKTISLRGAIVVKDLAELLGMRPNRLIAELMQMNILASINQRIEGGTARELAKKHGFEVEQEKKGPDVRPLHRRGAEDEPGEEDRPEDLVPRAPVVTFLGHVDHGKTSLLDRLRDASVAASEFGGITQHIGAYTIESSGRKITFLDTPGHAAFTAMRARGANMTDIAVIVIAADDGIMPQTREAISHAQAAEVSLVVAINKIDLPGANIDRVKQQLQAEGLTPEDWGGELICCPVSAETGEGLDHLLEMILLQSDVMELKGNPHRRARGFVIEAQLEPGMGPTSNLLVMAGELKVGDTILCGRFWGRVRALINDHGTKIKSAGPSTPVKCLGLSGVPEAGAEFRVCVSDKVARARADETRIQDEQQALTTPRKASLASLFEQLKEDEKLQLKVILKTDTQGSLEAIKHSLQEIESDKVSLDIVLGAAGNITVNDVMLASASNAVVLGFHAAKESGVDATARHEGVEVQLHQVIYELISQVREAMTGLLAPEIEERVLGRAEIRQVFPLGKTSRVAGCLVVSGTCTNSAKVRVKRGDGVVYEGAVASLKHFQDDVREVREAQECGVRVQGFTAFEEGDILEFYQTEEVAQTL